VAKRLKMKDLEQATGVGRETIRYYIHEGLLPQPERPSRNVAWYDESFVERIGLIKDLQRKRFLPLQVIKAIIDSDTAPSAAEIDALGELDGRMFRSTGDASAREPERLSAVAGACGLAAAEVLTLAEAGAIAIDTRDGDQWLDETAIEIVACWAELRAAGFTAELGFKPENTRLYADFVKLLAHEELRIFAEGITSGNVDAETSAAMGEAGIDQVNRMIALMRKAAILRSIREYGLPGTSQREAGSA